MHLVLFPNLGTPAVPRLHIFQTLEKFFPMSGIRETPDALQSHPKMNRLFPAGTKHDQPVDALLESVLLTDFINFCMNHRADKFDKLTGIFAD